jgi:hypothetical protein
MLLSLSIVRQGAVQLWCRCCRECCQTLLFDAAETLWGSMRRFEHVYLLCTSSFQHL